MRPACAAPRPRAPRERQQVVHQCFHAVRLLTHQRKVPRALLRIERKVLQRFDKAGQHRERRADFMRNIRDEVAPHGFRLLYRGNVAREQHAPVAGIRMHLHRKPHRMAALLRLAVAGGIDDDIAAVVPRGQVGHEGRVAHQVCKVLQKIALGIDAELGGRRLVAPFDAALLVEQDHAIGRRLDGRQKLLQALFGLPGLLLALAQGQLQGELDGIPSELAGYGLELAADGSELIYTYDTQTERAGIAALLADLNGAGIKFKDLQTKQSSLEDIFVSLVKERD